MADRAPGNDGGPGQPEPTSPAEQVAAAYDTYAAGLYRYALMILADRSSAEDAVHQTFVKLAARGERISEIASCNGYLRKAVRNECYRIIRRRKRTDNRDLGPESAAILAPVDGQAINEELRRQVEQALRSLPADQREVVHMKVYEQMTFQQIADELGISINTAASRYRYAIDKLRRLLGPSGLMEGIHND